jgi:hypothetical protein
MSEQADLGAVGRVREGRVDTGTQIFDNVAMTSAELVRRALTNAGLGLDNLAWYKKETEGRQPKFVVECVYTPKEGEIAEYSRQTTDALRELASIAWFCHVWHNPHTKVITINFVGMQNGVARNQITVRDDHISLLSGDTVTKGVPLKDVETVLVKFYFTNPRRIPQGIPEKPRLSDAEMDRRHAEQVASK